MKLCKKKIGLLTGILLIALLSGCTPQQPQKQPVELLEPVGVHQNMTTAYIGEISRSTYLNAYVSAYAEGVFFETDGFIAQVYAYPGKWVEAGELLAELNQSSLTERINALKEELEYSQRSNAYADAIEELKIQQLEVELRQLQAIRADSMQIGLKQNEIASAKAELRQKQQLRTPDIKRKNEELQQLEAQQIQSAVYAPFAGYVVSVQGLLRGASVKAYAPVVVIADHTRLSLIGDAAAESAVNGAYRIYARIGTNEYEIEAEPTDHQQQIRTVLSGGELKSCWRFSQDTEGVNAGDYAVVCIVSDYASDALLLPAGAVMQDADGYYVYVEEEGKRVRRSIETGIVNDALVEIVSGIGEGAAVYVKD